MHNSHLDLWQHQHTFNTDKKASEKRTLIVVIITFITMIAEILVGWLTNSMALFADGCHMGTHAFALGIAFVAYILARKYAKDQRFTFGTWKIEILGAYTSAIVLGIVALYMIFTSVDRLIHPLQIYYDQALIVAVIGLVINLASVLILDPKTHSHDHHHHEHEHDHEHSSSHDNKKDDLNLKAAYFHVLADALTSVFAIIALIGAKYFHINWLDPFMGLVGAALIIKWAASLLRETADILLEKEMDFPIANKIKELIETDGSTQICDLHLWKVASNKYACIIALVTGTNDTIEDYKARLKEIHELVHVTLEINVCRCNLNKGDPG